MQSNVNGPALSPWVGRFFAIVGIIVLFGGGLLYLPNVARPLWPWAITPFNAAFLGGIYLSELVVVSIIVVINRWSPGRLVLPMALCFVTVVIIVSLLSLSKFDLTKKATIAWFVAYIGSLFISGYFLLKYRSLPPANSTPLPTAWRVLLTVEGIALMLYGAGLLLLPDLFSGFWPWKIDQPGSALHAQIYSGLFLTGGLGSLLLSRAAAPAEYFTIGVAEAVLSLLTIGGMALTDASLKRINWTAPGTLFWIAMFVMTFIIGIGLLLQSRTRRAAAG